MELKIHKEAGFNRLSPVLTKFRTQCFVIVLCLLSSSIAKAAWPNFYECVKTSECVKVNSVCSGVTSINSKFINEFEAFTEEQASVSLCGPADPKLMKQNKLLIPKCENKNCTLVKPLSLKNKTTF